MKPFITIIFTILLFVNFSAFAQTPQAFNYQGVARDLSNNPLPNQSIGLQIAILRTSATGVEVYKETHAVTTNDLGLFNIRIGTGAVVSGIFANIGWSRDKHYVQIELDETGGTNYQLIGASQLLSVPYALQAGSSYWEQNGTDVFYDRGGVGIGTSTPTGSFHIRKLNASVMLEDTDPLAGDTYMIVNNTKGRDVLNFAIFNQTDLRAELSFGGDGNVAILNGSLGIGTSTPAHGSNLHIESLNPSIRFTDTDALAGDDYSLINNSLGNDVLNFAIYNQTDQRAELSFSGDGDVSILNGNMGIGTNDPKTKLQVTSGDVYIEDIASGVIMKSPNGQCWRMTVSNAGQSVFTSITCP